MNPSASAEMVEMTRQFAALGGVVDIRAAGELSGPGLDRAEAAIRDLQASLTRFEADSELSRLNSDPRSSVPASSIMLRFADLVGYAGKLSGGLVDATCLDAVEQAGYTESFDPDDRVASASGSGPAGGESRAGGPDPDSRWQLVSIDSQEGAVVRPPGVRLDTGGIGKGLAADIGAEELQEMDCFAVSCVGDIRFGGRAGVQREIIVSSPVQGDRPVARIHLSEAAIATSGITRRAWVDADGREAHHLINPQTGRPAQTGVVQVTAIAPTGVEAEVRAKAALLSGPEEAVAWLTHGGVAVLEDGRVIVAGDCVEIAGPTR